METFLRPLSFQRIFRAFRVVALNSCSFKPLSPVCGGRGFCKNGEGETAEAEFVCKRVRWIFTFDYLPFVSYCLASRFKLLEMYVEEDPPWKAGWSYRRWMFRDLNESFSIERTLFRSYFFRLRKSETALTLLSITVTVILGAFNELFEFNVPFLGAKIVSSKCRAGTRQLKLQKVEKVFGF